jgi:hypothetical protein
MKIDYTHYEQDKQISKNMSAKEMAREMVGDGQTPNMWFVTIGPYYHVRHDFDNSEFELLDGYTDSDSETFGPFLSYEAARTCYDLQDLDYQMGVGQVFIEDRECGQVTEKFLEKRVVVDYSYVEHDDSKLFYKQ